MNAFEIMQALVAFPTAHVIARRDAADEVRFTLCSDLRLALRYVATATCSARIHDARGSAIVNVNGRMPLYRARLPLRAEVRLLGGIEYARGRGGPENPDTRRLWRLADHVQEAHAETARAKGAYYVAARAHAHAVQALALAQTTLGAKP